MSEGRKASNSPLSTPAGKKFKPTSTEANVANAISQALQNQQSLLEGIVHNAVRAAMEEINNALQSLRADMQTQTTTVRGLVDKVDKIQADFRGVKKDIVNCSSEQHKLNLKVAELEDRSRRNNVRIVGLAPNREGDDPIGFLQKMLPVWIPTLSKKAPVEIDRAHRIYSQGTARTMIFRVLRYQDRQAILQGAREARKKEPTGIQDARKTLRFYADYSAFTVQRRQAFAGPQKELHARGIPNFLIYPAILRVDHKGEKLSFESPKEAEAFCCQLGNTSAKPTRRQLSFPPSTSTCESMDDN